MNMNNNASGGSNESRQTVPEYMSTEEIVSFTDQAALSSVDRGYTGNIPRSIQRATEFRDHEIRNFLGRPRPVSTPTWSTTDPAQTNIINLNCPDVLFTTEMPISKVADFRFFRCDIVFEFKINCNPFNVGRLVAFVQPVPALTGVNVQYLTRTSFTGFQHAFIDAGTAPSVTLRVPFVYRKSAYDFLYDSADPWATVQLWVFNALSSASGSTTAEVSIWAHAENIELGVPTRQHITPFPAPMRVAQMSTEAESAAKDGTMSGPLRKVGNLAKGVAGISTGPIKAYAGAASWIAEIAANALQSFGFSKPSNEQAIMPMVQQVARNYTHYNGADNSISMSGDARNSLDVDQGLFGQLADEMNIWHVCSTSMFIETFQWSMSDVAGTILNSWPVTPGFCGNFSTTEAASTRLAYVAAMFEYWRGALQYKLSMVANRFYSGRIGLAFLSGIFTLGASISLADVESCPKVVCDVRDSTECTFDVPFNLSIPYGTVRIASRTTTGTDMKYNDLLQQEVSQGLLVVYVVNSLVGPATVPTTIDVNMSISAGPDIEFQVPSCPRYCPKPYASMLDEKEEELDLRRFAQMNAVPENLNLQAGQLPASQHSLFITPAIADSCDFAKLCMGERFVSLRPLTRMFSDVAAGTMPPSTQITVDPAYFSWNVATILNPRLHRIARMFCFRRGSTRWKLFLSVPTDTPNPIIFVRTFQDSSPAASAPTNGVIPAPLVNNIGFEYTQNVVTNPVVEVSDPFYVNRFAEVISDSNNNARNKLMFVPTFVSGVDFALKTAGGDDLSFGYLIAPPNLIHLP